MTADWLYLTFRNGRLYDEDGDLYCERVFASEVEADAYLVDNDLRATIQ